MCRSRAERRLLDALRATTTVALALAAEAASAETLEEAWQAAVAADGRLAAAEARYAASHSALAAARAERLPSVTVTTATSLWRDTPAFDFSAAGLPGALPLFGGETLNTATAEVSVPLYTGGALAAGETAAAAARDGRSRLTDGVRQDLLLGVADAYVGVLRTQSALDVARSTSAGLAAHARDVEDMRSTGQVPTNDYLAAAVSLADARQRELAAQNALEVARALYNRRLGRPFDAAVTVEPLTEPLGGAAISAPLAQLVAAAHAERPELKELDAAGAALIARAAAARGACRPQLALDGGYAYLENEFLNREDFWFVRFSVRINVLDGGRSRHSSAVLEREAGAVADERRDRVAEIELEVHRAWAELTNARLRIEVATGAVEQAEENLRVVRDRYRNGEGTNTEVLDAEVLRAQSASNFDSARYDVRFAELTLARAVGAL
jgi:outer membrane protein TolC